MTAGGSAEIAQSGLAHPPAEFMAVDIGTAEVNPPQTRASLTSLEMAEKLSKLRVTPNTGG